MSKENKAEEVKRKIWRKKEIKVKTKRKED
jgi:hypothetical protein